MIFKNITAIVLMSIVLCYLCITAFRAKKNYIVIGAIMNILALIGMEILVDFPKEIRLSEFYKYYICILLVILAVFGLIVMCLKNDK